MTNNNKLIVVIHVIGLLAASITGIIQCTDEGRKFWESLNKKYSSDTINLSGDWKMTFDYARCSNPEFANKGFECYYDIKLFQTGNKVTGNGTKHSERFNGKITNYSRSFPVRIEGIIRGDELIANLFEKGSHDEITGTMTISLNKKWIFKGPYDANGKNCNGEIKMERKTPKPNN